MYAFRLAALLAALPLGAAAEESQRISLAVFAGRDIVDNITGHTVLPLASDFGDQLQFGAAIAATPYTLPLNLYFGWEVGLSVRRDGDEFGPPGTSAEFWMGPTFHHAGLSLGPVTVRPALTVGMTAVTNSFGLERTREASETGGADFLYFMAPELGIGTDAYPNVDLIYRFQHRSGGRNVGLPPLGQRGDTTNAYTFGLRWRF